MRNTIFCWMLVASAPAMAVDGIEGSAGYKLDWLNADGGGHTLGNLDLKIDFDLGALGGPSGGKLHFYGLGNHGGDPTSIVGDVQATSNIEAPADTFRLYEAYYLQEVGPASALAGLYDLNSEFYSAEGAGLFLNSTFGVGKELSQTGANGPSIFPVTALAVRLKFESESGPYVQAAVFNGQAGDPGNPYGTFVRWSSKDGTLSIAEAGWRSAGEMAFKAGLGCWRYSKPVATISDASLEAANSGCYGMVDQVPVEGFEYFLKYGIASPKVNSYSASLAVGIVWNGFGLGMAKAYLGGDEKDSRIAGGGDPAADETSYELTYKHELTEWLSVQPDVQRVVRPGLDNTAKDVTISGVRLEAQVEF